jgi:hypothetical protein
MVITTLLSICIMNYTNVLVIWKTLVCILINYSKSLTKLHNMNRCQKILLHAQVSQKLRPLLFFGEWW